MSHILRPSRVLLCLYCGRACSRGSDGEHIIPKAIGGRRTLNDATDRVAVCQECNNGPLAEADRELVGRSYLSIIASQRLNSLVWQTWDIDHRTGELIEALPVWSTAGEMLAFRCRPQLLFTGTRIGFYADHLQTAEFGFAHANRVLTKAAYNCFRETVNGGQNRIHYHRVHRHSFAADRRFSPRLFPSRPREWRAMADQVDRLSFTMRYVNADEGRRAFQALWRVACDGQQPAAGRRPVEEVQLGSHFPTVSIDFDVGATLRALFKIALNLIAAHCQRTDVSHRTFGQVARFVRDEISPTPWLIGRTGFVPPVMLRELHSEGGEHVFRLVHIGGQWQVYHSYFGGAVCAFTTFAGASAERWRTLEVVAPIRSRQWTVRGESPLIRPIPIKTTWGSMEQIIPSVPIHPRGMRFETSVRPRPQP